MENLAFLTHHTFYGKDDWCEGGMLDFHDSGVVLTFFLLLVFLQDKFDVFVFLAGTVCICDSDVKVGFTLLTPR